MRKKKPTRREILADLTKHIKVVPYMAPSNMWELPAYKEKMRIAEEIIRTVGLPKPTRRRKA